MKDVGGGNALTTVTYIPEHRTSSTAQTELQIGKELYKKTSDKRSLSPFIRYQLIVYLDNAWQQIVANGDVINHSQYSHSMAKCQSLQSSYDVFFALALTVSEILMIHNF